MKAPISWLKEYVDINVDINTLCEKMVAIGLEIEEVCYLGENVTNTVVGQILSIEQHPNADKLVVCKVDVKTKEIQIVTNSKTVKVGDKVPVALDGANLATGQHIVAGQLRGVHSDGMFCGPEELGITKDYYPNGDVDGVLVLKDTAVVGQDVRKEVGIDDYVIDVAVTSNRPDCNSVYGIAREIAVALGKKVKPLDVSYTEVDGNIQDYVSVEVTAPDLCPAYFMQAVKDVKIADSPLWMTSRLAKIGLHGISNMVDVTNYVLMEVGQPMHAFDESDLHDKTIIVRRAEEGETIIPLDGKEYRLSKDNLVIADKTRPVGLAGIMGGANSGIKPETELVVFEAAKFAHDNIRHSSRNLGLRSDSSARFEKGVDVYSVQLGLDRALCLVEKLGCGTIVKGRIAKVSEKPFVDTITFEYSRIKQLLGIEIDKRTVKKILNNLNLSVSYKGKEITCVVPGYRTDLQRYCDVIEEIIRVYGYDNISGTMLENSHITYGGKNKKDLFVDNCHNILTGMRYNQCIFYPFGGKGLYDKLTLKGFDMSKNIKLLNPLGEELSVMRTTMCADMLQCASLNHKRKNLDVKLYEYGAIYLAKALPLVELPDEKKGFCLFASGQNVDFDSFKCDVLTLLDAFDQKVHLERSKEEFLHPGISANVYVDGKYCGFFGKVHPTIAKNFGLAVDGYVAQLDFDTLYSLKNDAFKYQTFAKYPPVDRDFALVMNEEVLAQDVLDEIKKVCPLCEYAFLFDVYRHESLGQNNKSLAITVRFRDNTKTLTDTEIENQVSVCLKALKDKFGAVLRT